MANKTRLRYHLIFVTRYRKPILVPQIMNTVEGKIMEALHKFNIDVIAIRGDDKNHIHLLFEAKPTQSVPMIVRHLKQVTSYWAWNLYPTYLRKTYWYNNYFWSRGYFCSTTGDASTETIRKYIESQG